MAKQRLDALLARRGLFESRSRAAASVLAGDVLVGSGRQRAQKPGQMVDPEVELSVRATPPFVSRGGIKLANALDRTSITVEGRRALDVGACTGGFTDCLLKRGAAEVTAVDVGYGELDWGLRNDPRVTVLERTNARALEPAALPWAPDLVVIDVSFISLTKVLPAVLGCLKEHFDCLAMIKPQFEVGRGQIGSGGVVRDVDARRGALIGIGEFSRAMGVAVLDFVSSGLPGPKGNRETFVWLAEPRRAGGAPDAGAVQRLARKVEP